MIGIASAVVTDALRKAVAAGSVNGQTTEEIVDEHARPVVAMLDELVTLREAAVETEAEQRARGNEWRTRAQAAEAELAILREALAVHLEERAAYFDRAAGHWTRADTARSYRATAAEVRSLRLPKGGAA